MTAQDFEAKFVGKWLLDRNENLEAYAVEVGMNECLLQMLDKSPRETQTITRDGNFFHYVWDGPSPHEHRFILGEEFDGKDTAGNKVKIKLYMEDGKWCTNLSPLDSCAKAHNIIRDIVDGEMIMTVKVNQTTCKRIFKKIE